MDDSVDFVKLAGLFESSDEIRWILVHLLLRCKNINRNFRPIYGFVGQNEVDVVYNFSVILLCGWFFEWFNLVFIIDIDFAIVLFATKGCNDLHTSHHKFLECAIARKEKEKFWSNICGIDRHCFSSLDKLNFFFPPSFVCVIPK